MKIVCTACRSQFADTNANLRTIPCPRCGNYNLLRVRTKEDTDVAVGAVAGAALGGAVAGPLGLLIGAIIGGALGSSREKDRR
ncbi:MAG: hypothetical protein L6R43_08250 [Planctomycetes bacterium]|nr:hypothetical protein [Planctomycetota bacterium]